MSLEGKRIAIFLPSLGAGGVGRVFVDLANGFAARGCSVDFLLSRAEGPHLAHVDPAVKVCELARQGRFDTRRTILSLHPGPWQEMLRPVLLGLSDPTPFRSIRALADHLESARPDALLAGKTHANLAALWAAALAGASTRVVVSERTNLSLQMKMKRAWRWRHIGPAVARMYSRAHGITTVSDGVSEDLARTTGIDRRRIETVYNPFDTERIRALGRESAPHPWLDDDGARVLLAAGRLVPQKDFSTLLEAFARVVSRRNDPLRLLILGEGDERRRLEAGVHRLGLTERVDLPGYVENPYRFMSRASAFVLSSSWEGLPSALIEAIICGCPVVSTDCPSGPREILAGGDYGELVPVGDPGALADAIERVLDAPTDAALLEERSTAFEANAAVDRYLRLLLPD